MKKKTTFWKSDLRENIWRWMKNTTWDSKEVGPDIFDSNMIYKNRRSKRVFFSIYNSKSEQHSQVSRRKDSMESVWIGKKKRTFDQRMLIDAHLLLRLWYGYRQYLVSSRITTGTTKKWISWEDVNLDLYSSYKITEDWMKELVKNANSEKSNNATDICCTREL